MDRLISEKSLLDKIDEWKGFDTVTIRLSTLRNIVKAIPSAEPKTGQWIDLKEDNEMSDDDMWRYSCNMCHGQNYRKTLFCPNCGCPMEGA